MGDAYPTEFKAHPMPRVFIPPPLRSLTADQDSVLVAGRSVREVIQNLDRQFPGLKDRLCDGEQLKPTLVVAVGSAVNPLGLLARVEEDQEIHFLPMIGGG